MPEPDQVSEREARTAKSGSPQRVDIPREPEPRAAEASDAVGGREWEDKLAQECGLEICYFDGECNRCEEPTGRTWADVCRGMDFEEVNKYVCAKCLPKYHADYLRELAFWEEYAEHEIRRLEAAEGGRDGAPEQNGAQGYIDELTHAAGSEQQQP